MSGTSIIAQISMSLKICDQIAIKLLNMTNYTYILYHDASILPRILPMKVKIRHCYSASTS